MLQICSVQSLTQQMGKTLIASFTAGDCSLMEKHFFLRISEPILVKSLCIGDYRSLSTHVGMHVAHPEGNKRQNSHSHIQSGVFF